MIADYLLPSATVVGVEKDRERVLYAHIVMITISSTLMSPTHGIYACNYVSVSSLTVTDRVVLKIDFKQH